VIGRQCSPDQIVEDWILELLPPTRIARLA